MAHIESHTALRGVAALLVCLYHYAMFINGQDWVEAVSTFLAHGYVAVDLFFVLSGYILTARYASAFAGGIDARRWLGFMSRRFARLYPLHLAALALTVPFMLRRHADLPAAEFGQDLLLNLAMAQVWAPRPEVVFNFPSWSVSAEWAAYLLFPALAMLTVGRRRVALLALVLGGYGVLVWAGQGLNVEWELRLLRGLAGFGLGMLAFLWRGLGRIDSAPRLALAQGAAAAGLVAAMLQPGPVGVELMPFAAALTVLTHEDRGPLCALLRRRPAVRLGEISYSLYMLHMPVFWILMELSRRTGVFSRSGFAEAPWLQGGGFLLLCLATLLLLSRVSYDRLEMPSRLRLSTFLQQRLPA